MYLSITYTYLFTFSENSCKENLQPLETISSDCNKYTHECAVYVDNIPEGKLHSNITSRLYSPKGLAEVYLAVHQHFASYV